MEIKLRIELVDLLRHFNLPMVAAEVGVAQGLFSRDMLNAGIEKLYMVDIWERHPEIFGDADYPQEWHDMNYYTAKWNVYGKNAVILKGLSVNGAELIEDNSIGLVYLDAGHSYTSVMSDLDAWLPKLVSGGIMAGHDYLSEDYKVRQAVEDFARDKYAVHLIVEEQEEDAGFWFRKI